MRIAELKDKLLSSKIVRFVLVGGCSTGIDFVIYVLLSMQMPITISKGISMITASVCFRTLQISGTRLQIRKRRRWHT